MNKKAIDKYNRIQDLWTQKQKIEAELETLLVPEMTDFMPAGFSLNDEILKIITEAGTKGIGTLKIVESMRERYPAYGIDRKKIASSLAYLKNRKKQIVKVGRGIYRIVTEENNTG